MNNNKLFIKESITKYEAYKLNDLELLNTFFNDTIIESIKNIGIYQIQELNKFSLKELASLKGVGHANAVKLLAIYEISKRKPILLESQIISSPNDAFTVCRDIEDEEQEILKLLCLDTKNKIIKNTNIFKGGIDCSIVDIKVLFKEILRCNSKSFIIAHNHPSGNPNPSKEDIDITQRLKEASKIISVDFLDHIIVGKNNFISLKEKGII